MDRNFSGLRGRRAGSVWVVATAALMVAMATAATPAMATNTTIAKLVSHGSSKTFDIHGTGSYSQQHWYHIQPGGNADVTVNDAFADRMITSGLCTNLFPTVSCPSANVAGVKVTTSNTADRIDVNGLALPVLIKTGPGDDVVRLANQSDILTNNVVSVGKGTNTVIGGFGPDALHGGKDSDTLTGEAGADKLIGNSGDDTIFADDGVEDDVIDCGAGDDTVYADAGLDDPSHDCEHVNLI